MCSLLPCSTEGQWECWAGRASPLVKVTPVNLNKSSVQHQAVMSVKRLAVNEEMNKARELKSGSSFKTGKLYKSTKLRELGA